ncbi:hypothetical protein ES708_00542 [subsurface metagenome]
MNLIIINSGQNDLLQKCINSLIETVEPIDFDIQIIKEEEYREVTLNAILKRYGYEDLLIFGDDIIFTKEWFKFLMANRNKGDIIGFSMLYPGTDKVQDTGYDLISIDNKISLKPQNRGKKVSDLDEFVLRECDSVNGCALYIKKEVISKIPQISLDGMNRWGEYIYMNKAKKLGYKIIVLGHYLYHYGKSTKNNPNKILSSESYLLERRIWRNIVDKYIDKNQIAIHIKKTLSNKLKKIVLSNKKILFYGAGTVSEFIYNKLKNNLDLNNIDFCSGLIEEKGKLFCNKRIIFYKDINFKNYDAIIITVFQKEKEIFNVIRTYIIKQKIYYITQDVIGSIIKFDIKKYHFNI